jgi:hypothetical protein
MPASIRQAPENRSAGRACGAIGKKQRVTDGLSARMAKPFGHAHENRLLRWAKKLRCRHARQGGFAQSDTLGAAFARYNTEFRVEEEHNIECGGEQGLQGLKAGLRGRPRRGRYSGLLWYCGAGTLLLLDEPADLAAYCL